MSEIQEWTTAARYLVWSFAAPAPKQSYQAHWRGTAKMVPLWTWAPIIGGIAETSNPRGHYATAEEAEAAAMAALGERL